MGIKGTATTSNSIGQFTADKDYYGETEDGRSFLKAAKGTTIPMADAVAMGLVKGEQPAAAEAPAEEAETESKAKQPAANKAKAPAENKGK